FESGVVNDPDLTTRLAAFVSLAHMPTSDAIKNAVSGLLRDSQNGTDQWLSAALNAAAVTHGVEGVDGSGEFEPTGPNLLAGANWETRNHSGRGSFTKIDNGTTLQIKSDSGADSSYSAAVDVKPAARYRFAGQIRTKGVKGAMGALFNVHELQGNGRVTTRALKGDKDWTAVSVDFDPQGNNRLTFNALLGGWGRSTGTAHYKSISLHELAPVVSETAAPELAKADPDRGKNIFFTHQIAACNRCHQIGGEGGVVGPALDGIAARKAPDYLRQSMLEPNADIAEGFPSPVSPMPPMNLLLSEQEVEDVLAYLATLK
ncbi:MAG: c-type cytochrome, partial [Verrucomicrobiales bacterium]|nr:c-type cytochrome [Verrucomicrobiales bacterium]